RRRARSPFRLAQRPAVRKVDHQEVRAGLVSQEWQLELGEHFLALRRARPRTTEVKSEIRGEYLVAAGLRVVVRVLRAVVDARGHLQRTGAETTPRVARNTERQGFLRLLRPLENRRERVCQRLRRRGKAEGIQRLAAFAQRVEIPLRLA